VFALVTFGPTVFNQTNTVQNGIGTTDRPGYTHLRVRSKPEPARPEFPVLNPTTIVISAVFRKDGKITDLKFVRAIPSSTPKKTVEEFTKLCKGAAREIKFEPAIEDGKPVSMRMMLEYEFKQVEDDQ